MKTDFIKNRKFRRTLFLLAAVFYLICNTPKDQSNNIILTQINDKAISATDFLDSSEVTIRYNNSKDENPSFNNLMTENILAREAEQNDHESLIPIYQRKLKAADRDAIYNALWTIEKYLNDYVDVS